VLDTRQPIINVGAWVISPQQ